MLGYIRDLPHGEMEPTMYTVTGLAPENTCIIGYAGRGLNGQRKWFLYWYRNAERLFTPDALKLNNWSGPHF